MSGIFVRDYLLDTVRERAPEYRQRLAAFRETNRETLAELRAIARSRGEDDSRILSLEANLDDYWEGFEPLFDWTIVEKINQSASFLRREVLPRREAVLAIAQEIEELNNANLAAQRAEVTRQQTAFRQRAVHAARGAACCFGLLLAIPVVIRLRVLERRSDQQKEQARTKRNARCASCRSSWSPRRKRSAASCRASCTITSGQMLTALRMELGRIERQSCRLEPAPRDRRR